MTLFMASQTPTLATLFTDTLVTDTAGGANQPVLFRSKVWTYPHQSMAMVVTGFADLGDDFDARLKIRMGLRDIEDVNRVAQTDLQELFADAQRRYAVHFPGEPIGTATVYLFGFPEGTTEMVRYAYRSPNSREPDRNFEPERRVETETMFFAKPPPLGETWPVPETREELVALALQIKKENGDGTDHGKVAIGGEIYLTQIEPHRIVTELLYRFPDYDESWQKMNDYAASKP